MGNLTIVSSACSENSPAALPLIIHVMCGLNMPFGIVRLSSVPSLIAAYGIAWILVFDIILTDQKKWTSRFCRHSNRE